MSDIDPDPDTDAAHQRVRDAIAETGAGLAPRPGWEDRVWARIDAGDAGDAGGSRASRRWGWVAGGAALAAAAVVLLLWAPWRDRGGGGEGGGGGSTQVAVLAPTIEIRHGDQQVRGTAAAPGDTAVIRHAMAGASVWVYRGEATLVLACDAAHVAVPTCHLDGATVVVELVLDRPGTYHVLTATGRRDAPPTIDEALAGLTTAGVRFGHDELDVR